jgi:hypothetical protein
MNTAKNFQSQSESTRRQERNKLSRAFRAKGGVTRQMRLSELKANVYS